MLRKSVITTLLSIGISVSGAQAGLFGYTFNKLGDSTNTSTPNPCNSETFNKKYGQYCSGMFTKTIRCLSDGSNPGVCDSAAVCDTLDRTAKKLCETHCLNTTPQKMGNQTIKVSCAPNPHVQENMKGINLTDPSQNNQSQTEILEGIDSEISVNPVLQMGEDRGRKEDTDIGIVREVDSTAIRGNDTPTGTMSIREPNEGAQDSESADANIYQTEHPKSYDQINTEQPWTMSPDLPFAIEGNLGNGIGSHHHGRPSVSVGGILSRQSENPGSETVNPEGLTVEEEATISTYPLDEVDQPTSPQSTNIHGSPISVFESYPAGFEGYASTAYHNLRNYQFNSMPD